MKQLTTFLVVLFAISLITGCKKQDKAMVYKDIPFDQEYHQAYAIGSKDAENDVRSITIDLQGTIWVATGAGFFKKQNQSTEWQPILIDTLGPAYAVQLGAGGEVYLGSWNGLYTFKNNIITKSLEVQGPVSQLVIDKNATYAIGPKGLWIKKTNQFEKSNASLPGSVRDVVSDDEGGLWIASDVGLYHWNETEIKHYFNERELISGYVRGLAFDNKEMLWAGGLGGVTIRNNQEKLKTLTPQNGIPSVFVNKIRKAPDETMWVGTAAGVVRYYIDGTHSLRFSRRWLMDDNVQDIAFDKHGTAWIATPKGVSAIGKRTMNLAQKQDFFYDVLIKRHMRAPWTAGVAELKIAGDTASWQPEDDDNDGEFTGNYLAMESFRYASTKDPEAKINAKKAFDFLKLLADITETDGFFARSIVPSDWTEVHDPNLTYTPQEIAEELVKEPRFKPVEKRWHLSKDGKWLWKGDTSTDEMCGHMFGYYFYYTLVADDVEKKIIAKHIGKIMDHLIRNNYNLIDIDGTHTRWSVWSPNDLNRNPEWFLDRNQNSMEMLAFLKLAYHTTKSDKYEKEYRRLIETEGYLENMSKVTQQNPAWFIYFDVVLQAYLYPMLIKGETDQKLLDFYKNHFEKWYEQRRADENPLINFIYNYTLDKKVELNNSVDFLIDTPLDLIDWPIDHSKREDISLVRWPSMDEQQLVQLPPASMRLTVRWDKNPWTLRGGDPHVEREPVFWLLPYWMGRYLEMIEE